MQQPCDILVALQSNEGPPAQPGAPQDRWVRCLIQQARHLLLRRQRLAGLPAYLGALIHCRISPHGSLRHPRRHLKWCCICTWHDCHWHLLRMLSSIADQEAAKLRRRHSPAPDMHLTAMAASKANLERRPILGAQVLGRQLGNEDVRRVPPLQLVPRILDLHNATEEST